MPFALVGVTLGFRDSVGIDGWVLLLVVFCMVTARNAAMAFNRWADRQIDAKNPRTAVRDIPAGRVKPGEALLFVVVNCVLFVVATWFINRLVFYLSPVALAVVLGYSYTKRFTSLAHLVLGVGLGLAPVGAYLAVTASFHPGIVLLGVGVMCWVGGFDIIYALQDEEFDRAEQLKSIPAWLGAERALWVSRGLHFVAALSICGFAWLFGGGWLLPVAVAVFVLLLAYQHRIVSPRDLSRVNLAFFTTNGIASLVFGVLVISDIVLVQSNVYPPLWQPPL